MKLIQSINQSLKMKPQSRSRSRSNNRLGVHQTNLEQPKGGAAGAFEDMSDIDNLILIEKLKNQTIKGKIKITELKLQAVRRPLNEFQPRKDLHESLKGNQDIE